MTLKEIKELVAHTPAKLLIWKGRDRFSYEAVFPDGFSIEGESRPTKEEARFAFVEAWNDGTITKNGRFRRKLYPYWG